ncbi:MAG: CDP-alcohol phosphatidyltransferase family protein [Candidatus Bathyarchaeia archaeon]|nr:CDP-alcohol phosphatidyltransferase family protein [Candidatus Bathyarchaeota archaeon]
MNLNIKWRIRRGLELLAGGLAGLGVNPNHLTMAGLILSGVAALSYAHRENLMAAVFLTLGGLSDALDGALARSIGEATKFGGVLDSTMDRIGEALIYTGVIAGGYCPSILGLSTLASSYLVSYVRGRGEMEGIEMEGVGIGERPERLIILIVFTALNMVGFSMVLLTGLSILTVYQRLTHVMKMSRIEGERM